MFTGIVEALGAVEAAGRSGLRLASPFKDLVLGESVAVNGVCLTVSSFKGPRADFDVSAETLSKTTLGSLRRGDRVNLERALRLGDRVGGHLMTGHVDGVGRVAAAGERFAVAVPGELARFLALKGSLAVEGVSLTIASLHGCRAGMALVPHTLKVTTLGRKRAGDRVNLEVDIIARYLR